MFLTAPYGHNGVYPPLKGIIKHHLNPVAKNKIGNLNMQIYPVHG